MRACAVITLVALAGCNALTGASGLEVLDDSPTDGGSVVDAQPLDANGAADAIDDAVTDGGADAPIDGASDGEARAHDGRCRGLRRRARRRSA